ncbi:MAG: M48 family metalloprotease [Deltaproteobacteria bacterium]|nr:M48 family metalloprotease [Deltaproteobacteria bacterium]
MFGNFIYFIIVLLIYTTYTPSEDKNFAPVETLFLFLLLTFFYFAATWVQFHRLERRISKESHIRLDHKISTATTRQSVMAIMIFAIDIYVLNLKSFLSDIPYLSIIPTFQAVLILGLFIFYLSIVWACAHGVQQKLHMTDMSGQSYVLSNISFSIPILLPWFLFSGIADIINVLPFETPKHYLATTEGQAIYFLVFLFAVAVIGPAMIQKLWQCKPLETGYARNRIEALCQKAGVGYNNILYWPIFGGRMITAGVMGLIRRFRYILVTDALLRLLEPEEVDAVIAHEIGHVKQKHLLFYLVFFVGYLMLSYATFDLVIYFVFYLEPIYRFIMNAGLKQAAVTSAIFNVTIILIFLVYFRFLFGYFMRNFERQADAYVYALFESAKPLISTLEKIAITSGQSPDKPNWHHFSISERINFLEKCETDMSWKIRHDRKITKSISAYMVGMLIVGGIGYHLNFGETGKRLNTHFFEKIIQREVEKTPDKPELYSMLGDLHYSNKNYEETVAAYERAIALKANNPEVLNNLAWLYATCEVKRFRHPEKALELAKKAAGLKEDPHILDTLAESYYVNKRFEAAVSAERRALEQAGQNRTHYETQLKKFMEAAEAAP